MAHAYVSKGYVWEAIPDSKIAYHLADGTSTTSGNWNYYGIEVSQSMNASDAVFLANEQAVFQYAAMKLKEWRLPANRNTVRLHMEFSLTACPHRSMTLHTGWNPVKKGNPPEEIRLKLKDYFIKQIRAYMDGKVPVSTVSKNNSASSNTVKPVASGWKINQYGTYYMSEKATFTVGNQPIAVHATGPFVNLPITGWLQPGQSITYDEVMLQDGHVWVSYVSYAGQELYLPIRTWNGVAPPNQGLGGLWGNIS